jgi:hypothetical protein
MACSKGGVCGINVERDEEKTRALDAVRRAYPGGDWSAFASERIAQSPVDSGEAARLCRYFEEILPVLAFLCPAGPNDLGDWIYLLAGLHAPCLFDLREGRAVRALRDRETYVRVGLSPLGRFATLQEVELCAERADGFWVVREERRLGVQDSRLRTLVKALGGALRKNRLVLLDFAFLAQPPERLDQAAFVDRFGVRPVLFNFLFDPAPPATIVTAFVAAK